MADTVNSNAVTKEEAAAMLRATLNLFDRWGVQPAQKLILLGGVSRRTLQRWQAGGQGITRSDLLCRMADLLGIHISLRYMFTTAERGYRWVKRPNKVFGERTPLEIMLGGAASDITRVRVYLASERFG